PKAKGSAKEKTPKMSSFIFGVFSCRGGAARRSTLYCNLLPANLVYTNFSKVFGGAWGAFSKKPPTYSILPHKP
ncbi:MAG: hypothetical protein IJA52_05010, partial [Clostridia bacterium]|nr:hypothetical protein [Clostridia bacterium]